MLLATVAQLATVSAFAGPLEDGFTAPPAEARPRIWWHWMDGNVNEDGIRRDLAWMSAIGLGGVQIIDVALGAPKLREKPVVYGAPEWRNAMALAISEGNRLGLEMGIGAGPGWSGAGGPWVAPRDGMKKLVWSEAVVEGGGPVGRQIPPPPTTTGTFQTITAAPMSSPGAHTVAVPKFAADVATLAFPVGKAVAQHMVPDRVTVAGRTVRLGNGPLDIEANPGVDPAIVLHFAKPRPISALTVGFAAAGMFVPFFYEPRLEASSDGGTTWSTVARIPYRNGVPTTVSFPTRMLADLRIVLGPASQPPGPPRESAAGVEAFAPFAASKGAPRLIDLQLHAEPRIDLAEIKAGFAVTPDYLALPVISDGAKGVPTAAVTDISAHVKPDGSIDWTPPTGRWKIMRFGYSLVGTTNHPTSPQATGLEVDKLDGAATRRYLDAYLALHAQAAPLGKGGIRTLTYDSAEAGAANWTADMVARFRSLRGYDPTPWLPALAGEIVEDRSASEKFLSDFRTTVADLVATEHYATVRDVAHHKGLVTYFEALEGGRPALGNDLAMRRSADVPMGAMWTWIGNSGPGAASFADLRGAASVAHFYGKRLVSAESMTSVGQPWGWSPASLKKVIDLEFALGVNQPVIHSSVHIADETKSPGISLMDVGVYFNRKETWSGMARPWIDYMARTSYLLQQGEAVSDLAYFMGEEAPLTGQFGSTPDTAAPTEHGFDYIDAQALRELRVEGGSLISPGGMHYHALYLGNASRNMTLATLRAVASLVGAGATIIGERPADSPSLADDSRAFAALADTLWGGAAAAAGRVIASNDASDGLRQAGGQPDLSFSGAGRDDLAWIHRRAGQSDIYFVVNRTGQARSLQLSLRRNGVNVQVWRAEDGSRRDAAFSSAQDRTLVPLELAANDAVFVILGGDAPAGGRAAPSIGVQHAVQVDGPWTLHFENGRGAPASLVVPTLKSLDTFEDQAIRYYSGTVRYETTLKLKKAPGRETWLDLGDVREVAEVTVNGKPVRTVWRAPFRTQVGGLLRKGSNMISIRVANLWVNRLIGDKQPGATPVTFTSIPAYRADAPLRPSGLIGPVTLVTGTP